MSFNPFVPNAPFLYPQKTSENILPTKILSTNDKVLKCLLTHFFPIHAPFRQHLETSDFLIFSGGQRTGALGTNGLRNLELAPSDSTKFSLVIVSNVSVTRKIKAQSINSQKFTKQQTSGNVYCDIKDQEFGNMPQKN